MFKPKGNRCSDAPFHVLLIHAQNEKKIRNCNSKVELQNRSFIHSILKYLYPNSTNVKSTTLRNHWYMICTHLQCFNAIYSHVKTDNSSAVKISF